jgi:predicted nucleic acid-binding protein
MIVVADTSPINYLLLIGHIDILPHFYGRIVVPPAVWQELEDTSAAGRLAQLVEICARMAGIVCLDRRA